MVYYFRQFQSAELRTKSRTNPADTACPCLLVYGGREGGCEGLPIVGTKVIKTSSSLAGAQHSDTNSIKVSLC